MVDVMNPVYLTLLLVAALLTLKLPAVAKYLRIW